MAEKPEEAEDPHWSENKSELSPEELEAAVQIVHEEIYGRPTRDLNCLDADEESVAAEEAKDKQSESTYHTSSSEIEPEKTHVNYGKCDSKFQEGWPTIKIEKKGSEKELGSEYTPCSTKKQKKKRCNKKNISNKEDKYSDLSTVYGSEKTQDDFDFYQYYKNNFPMKDFEVIINDKEYPALKSEKPMVDERKNQPPFKNKTEANLLQKSNRKMKSFSHAMKNKTEANLLQKSSRKMKSFSDAVKGFSLVLNDEEYPALGSKAVQADILTSDIENKWRLLTFNYEEFDEKKKDGYEDSDPESKGYSADIVNIQEKTAAKVIGSQFQEETGHSEWHFTRPKHGGYRGKKEKSCVKCLKDGNLKPSDGAIKTAVSSKAQPKPFNYNYNDSVIFKKDDEDPPVRAGRPFIPDVSVAGLFVQRDPHTAEQARASRERAYRLADETGEDWLAECGWINCDPKEQ